MEKRIAAPIDKETVRTLIAGDYVYITGTIYTARDAAHKRMKEALDRSESFPFDIRGQIIYYMGPSPARDGRSHRFRGPTTASRMDRYTTRTSRPWAGSHDWKGKAYKRGTGCSCKKPICLFCGSRRSWSFVVQMYPIFRGDRLRRSWNRGDPEIICRGFPGHCGGRL